MKNTRSRRSVSRRTRRLLRSHLSKHRCRRTIRQTRRPWRARPGKPSPGPAAARGGDPDPYDDESTVEIAGGKISWTGGGGGGPYAVANLPATVRSPDSEEIKFSLNSGGDLVVEFGYASPATIVYARQGAPN